MAKTIEQKYPGKSAEYYDLVREYTKLAKQADQRLVRLERYAEQENFKTAKLWAYKRAQKDIEHWGGTNRFNTKPPASIQDLRAKVNDIKNFLEKPSSTKKGIKSIYQKKADTINEKYGTNFTWQQLGKYFESGMANKLDSSIGGSKTVLKTIGQYNKKKEEIIAAIKKADETHLIVENKDVNDAIKAVLAGQNVSFKDLVAAIEDKDIQASTGYSLGRSQMDRNLKKLANSETDWESII